MGRCFRGRAGVHQAARLRGARTGVGWSLKKLVAGNWKMHGLSSDIAEIEEIAAAARDYPEVDVALCVPAILIERAARAVPNFAIGGQDVHHAEKGAHTGCTSALMLRDAGAKLTIVGHSERRDGAARKRRGSQSESGGGAFRSASTSFCASARASRCARAVVRSATVRTQLDGSLPAEDRTRPSLAIAYEPIWAIGTGKIPTVAEIGEMHAAIRERLRERYGELGDVRCEFSTGAR